MSEGSIEDSVRAQQKTNTDRFSVAGTLWGSTHKAAAPEFAVVNRNRQWPGQLNVLRSLQCIAQYRRPDAQLTVILPTGLLKLKREVGHQNPVAGVKQVHTRALASGSGGATRGAIAVSICGVRQLS
ncbi:hypothetical protein [Ochrobactrum soli]|uniref:hypothetical protein n=1 Tax=Ochrobactrum soli TaxID=2448455 RepID=UPI000D68D37A|nr:hypothetical protein [[Ochrobactrum] soli]